MNRSQNLYRLQQVDSQIDQANRRLKEIETILSNDVNLRKATLLANRAAHHLEETERALRQAETKVKDQRIKIEQTEATLYSGNVKNPKELQDLQNEVTALKRFLETLEERQLEAMLLVDEASEKNLEAQNILAKFRAQAESQQATLFQEREQLQTQNTALEKQKGQAAQQVAAEDLSTYEKLRKKKAGVAVAKVRDKVCGACGSTLTAALHQAARSPSQVVFCDSCGRILHAD